MLCSKGLPCGLLLFFTMMEAMFRITLSLVVLVGAVVLGGCGTSTAGPIGSKHQTMSGVSESNYPAGQPKDAESPALASSSEQENSKPGPKVPTVVTPQPK